MPAAALGGAPGRRPRHLWRLIVSTVGTCFRNRVTGLAAEAAFFALLSLPPLLFGLAGSIGYVFDSFSPAQVEQVRGVDPRGLLAGADPADGRQRSSGRRSTTSSRAAAFDVISIGFILALWSGSRALNVFVDTITIMYGLGGHRGIVRTRVLSFSLYVMGLVTGVVTIPLVVAGPGLVRPGGCRTGSTSSTSSTGRSSSCSCVCFLATLYHVSVPVRTSWRYNLPGRRARRC